MPPFKFSRLPSRHIHFLALYSPPNIIKTSGALQEPSKAANRRDECPPISVITLFDFLTPQNRNPPTRNPNSRKLRLECTVRRRRSDRVRTFGCSPAVSLVIAKPAATVPATGAIVAASVACGADAGISPGSLDTRAPGGAGMWVFKLEVSRTCAFPTVVGPTELFGASFSGG